MESTNSQFLKTLNVDYKAQAYDKKMTILYFVHFGTHNTKIYTIYKQTSVVVLVLLAKQQQQIIVNLYTISVCCACALVDYLNYLDIS
jgi:hypothetical protein